jgi:putative serine protease PepD
VQAVAGGSPADRAGLRGGDGEQEFEGLPFCPGGDIIVAVDGKPVQSAEDVVRAVNQQRFPGDEIRLTVLRGDERLVLKATLGDRPANPPNLAC